MSISVCYTYGLISTYNTLLKAGYIILSITKENTECDLVSETQLELTELTNQRVSQCSDVTMSDGGQGGGQWT